MKTAILFALTLLSSAAFANEGFQWKKLTAEQRQNLNACHTLRYAGPSRDAVEGGLLLAMASVAASADADVSMVPVSVTGATVTLGAGVDALKAYFNDDELVGLVNEQDAGRPGLLTEKLTQIAAELQLDPSALLKVVNEAAGNRRCSFRQDLPLKSNWNRGVLKRGY